jgi:hypothetical protein
MIQRNWLDSEVSIYVWMYPPRAFCPWRNVSLLDSAEEVPISHSALSAVHVIVMTKLIFQVPVYLVKRK